MDLTGLRVIMFNSKIFFRANTQKKWQSKNQKELGKFSHYSWFRHCKVVLLLPQILYVNLSLNFSVYLCVYKMKLQGPSGAKPNRCFPRFKDASFTTLSIALPMVRGPKLYRQYIFLGDMIIISTLDANFAFQ